MLLQIKALNARATTQDPEKVVAEEMKVRRKSPIQRLIFVGEGNYDVHPVLTGGINLGISSGLSFEHSVLLVLLGYYNSFIRSYYVKKKQQFSKVESMSLDIGWKLFSNGASVNSSANSHEETLEQMNSADLGLNIEHHFVNPKEYEPFIQGYNILDEVSAEKLSEVLRDVLLKIKDEPDFFDKELYEGAMRAAEYTPAMFERFKGRTLKADSPYKILPILPVMFSSTSLFPDHPEESAQIRELQEFIVAWYQNKGKPNQVDTIKLAKLISLHVAFLVRCSFEMLSVVQLYHKQYPNEVLTEDGAVAEKNLWMISTYENTLFYVLENNPYIQAEVINKTVTTQDFYAPLISAIRFFVLSIINKEPNSSGVVSMPSTILTPGRLTELLWADAIYSELLNKRYKGGRAKPEVCVHLRDLAIDIAAENHNKLNAAKDISAAVEFIREIISTRLPEA